MGVKIHRTACVESGAELSDEVSIGEYAVVRDNVHLGECVEIGPHTLIEGHTTIGAGTRIFHSTAVGLPPQDLKYSGEPTELLIGEENIIREFVTIHRGTSGGNGMTRIGDRNLLMAYVHIAHDCQIGDDVIIANASNLGGHVVIGDSAVIGGVAAIHQFVHIGTGAMIGAASLVLQDVIPFALVSGNPAKVLDINRIGMRRRGFQQLNINRVHRALTIITRMGLPLKYAVQKIKDEIPSTDEIEKILVFIQNRSKRGIMRGTNIAS